MPKAQAQKSTGNRDFGAETKAAVTAAIQSDQNHWPILQAAGIKTAMHGIRNGRFEEMNRLANGLLPHSRYSFMKFLRNLNKEAGETVITKTKDKGLCGGNTEKSKAAIKRVAKWQYSRFEKIAWITSGEADTVTLDFNKYLDRLVNTVTKKMENDYKGNKQAEVFAKAIADAKAQALRVKAAA